MTRGARLVALALGALGLLGQATLRGRLEARQEQAGLVIPSADTGGLSADVAVPMLALGAFRGLVVDYLWLRTTSYRAQGKHYESRQVAEQICRLQPRLPEVWSFLAHDLAYNVTAAVEDADSRWTWIQNGIALLRDQGLRYNPGDPDLCFMLVRIYQDKIGTTADDHHMLFKTRHALLAEGVLGDAPLEELAASPGLEALLAADAEARAFVEQAAQAGVEVDAIGLVDLVRADQEPLRSLHTHPAWPRVLLAARRDTLRLVLGFEPERMLRIDRAYGPLDWRSCDAAACYWGHLGLETATRLRRWRDHYTLLRTLHASLKNTVRRGRVEKVAGGVFLAAKPELIPRVDRFLRDALEEAARVERELTPLEEAGRISPEDAERLDAAVLFQRNQATGREGFLGEAVVILSEYGLEGDARRLHARAQRDFPENPLLGLPYDEFVLKIMAQRFVDAGTYLSQVGVTQLLEGTWVSAYTAYARGEDDRYRGMESLAASTIRRWEAYVASLATSEPDAPRRLRVDYDAIRERSRTLVARTLPPVLVERLAERLGLTSDALRGEPR